MFHQPLLEIASGLETLEELSLEDWSPLIARNGSDTAESEGVLWPQVLTDFPDLAARLTRVSMCDEDVPFWAELEMPKLRAVQLVGGYGISEIRRLQ
jgi:hypothetical protein